MTALARHAGRRRLPAWCGTLALAVATSLAALSAVPSAASGSPHRSRIAFTRNGLWVADHTGADATLVVPAEGEYPDRQPTAPAWSHDGSWIAYVLAFEIWIVRPDGSGRRRVMPFQSSLPSWSRDDQRIYYTRYGSGAMSNVNWIDINSGDYGFLAEAGERDLAAVVAPDGRIALSTYTGDGYGIDVIQADGTGRAPLTRMGPEIDDVPVAWSPDGGQLLVMSNIKSSRLDAVVVNADGTGRRTARANALPRAWSPDGSRLLFGDPRTEALSTMRVDGSDVLPLNGLAGDADWGPGTVSHYPSPTTSLPPAPTATTAPSAANAGAPTTAAGATPPTADRPANDAAPHRIHRPVPLPSTLATTPVASGATPSDAPVTPGGNNWVADPVATPNGRSMPIAVTPLQSNRSQHGTRRSSAVATVLLAGVAFGALRCGKRQAR